MKCTWKSRIKQTQYLDNVYSIKILVVKFQITFVILQQNLHDLLNGFNRGERKLSLDSLPEIHAYLVNS